MSSPTLLFNQKDLIFFELSPGKIGKDGNVSIQKEQKKNTCSFYAMKRILTTEQIRSTHGRLCSERRKAITAASDNFSNIEQYHKARTVGNRTFLEKLGKNPEQAGREFLSNVLKITMPEQMIPAPLNEFMDKSAHIPNKTKPLFELQMIDYAADLSMYKGHGLEKVAVSDLLTIEKLIETLTKKGPLLVFGLFGKSFYAGKKPIKLSEKLGEHELYGWRRGTPTSTGSGIGHVINIVGAEMKDGRNYVYWIDPNDRNDPADIQSQKIYISSLSKIVSNLCAFEGLPVHALNSEAKNIATGAFCNPAFAPDPASSDVIPLD